MRYSLNCATVKPSRFRNELELNGGPANQKACQVLSHLSLALSAYKLTRSSFATQHCATLLAPVKEEPMFTEST